MYDRAARPLLDNRSAPEQIAADAEPPSMTITIDSKELAAIIENMLASGMARDNWLPADLAACQRKGESITDMRQRFAHERANNIRTIVEVEAQLAAEEHTP